MALTPLTLTKLHGLGNDFLVSLQSDGDPNLARRLCERHTGIGAYGLITSRLLGPGSPKLDFRLWNADGSEAEMSGNGMRCLAHAALDAGWVGENEPFEVATPAGVRQVTVQRRAVGATWGSVGMGRVRLGADGKVCNIGRGEMFVDVGNPHLVILGSDPAQIDVGALGPALERSVEGGVNVEFVALGPGTDTVTMRVWERGVGETQACGTGSVAVAAAVRHWGRVGTAVTVRQPGGSVSVELHPDGTATLAGPAERIATCQVDLW